MNSYVHGFRSSTTVCMQLLPNASAFFTPCQVATGFGARHLRSPTGGAANGSPLKTVTDGSRPGRPDTRPPATRTGASKAPRRGAAAIETRMTMAEMHTLRMDDSSARIVRGPRREHNRPTMRAYGVESRDRPSRSVLPLGLRPLRRTATLRPRHHRRLRAERRRDA